MDTKTISRRDLLKSTGVLVVGFSMWSPLTRAFAAAPSLDLFPEAGALDSWIAVAADGSVTVTTSKVDLGTGIITALSQIVAEELDVPFEQIRMETGDTSHTIDQAATVGSQTIARSGPQLRQAAAAARQQLLKLASVILETPVEKLTVSDGVVSVVGSPRGEDFLRQADRRKALRPENHGVGNRENSNRSSRNPGQGSEDLQDCRDFRSARGPAAQIHRGVHIHGGRAGAGNVARTGGSSSDFQPEACQRG